MMFLENTLSDKVRIINEYASVFDIIKVVAGQKNPRKTWADIKNSNRELFTVKYYKFKGNGQRYTPCIKSSQIKEFIKILVSVSRLSIQKKEEILKSFGMIQLPLKRYIEEDIHDKLIKCFLNHKCIKQFSVLKYRIDLYLPELGIAIECDENHEKYNQECEINRQNEITKELKCTWIRYKPYETDFDLFSLINNIHLEILTK